MIRSGLRKIGGSSMSFLIAVYVNEGIVLASDRRTTYNRTETINGAIVQKIGLHTTNSTEKTFLCPNGAGISTCGDASLLGKPITGYIKEVIRGITPETPISDVPQMLVDYFRAQSIVPDTHFFVAGYDKDNDQVYQRLYKVNLKDENLITPVDTSTQGASWDGEIMSLTRLVQNVAVKRPDGTYVDLPNEEILWGYFTLQDAIDFARYAVETTINTMRFKNVVETVGGNVDILVITPEETKWLQKTELK